MKKYWLFGIIAILLFLVARDDRLIVRDYTWQHPKAANLPRPVVLALITDLHSCFYGENAQQIMDVLRARNPDAILLGGDIYDDELPTTHTDALLSQLGSITPNVYYVNGNHELYLPAAQYQELERKIRDFGIEILHAQGAQVIIDNAPSTLHIWGVSDPVMGRFEADLQAVGARADASNINLLLSHRPERIDEYTRYPFDIITSGHAHGGQWRLPMLINGIFAPDQGLLPSFAGGEYFIENQSLDKKSPPSAKPAHSQFIVSRGLARESTRIVPRIFNRPELVFITLKP